MAPANLRATQAHEFLKRLGVGAADQRRAGQCGRTSTKKQATGKSAAKAKRAHERFLDLLVKVSTGANTHRHNSRQ